MSLRAPHHRKAHAAPRLLGLVLCAILAGCTAEQPGEAASSGDPATVPGSAQQVEAKVGEASVTAVAMQTSRIPASVAAEHDIEQRDDLLMLRVSARHGEMGNVTSAPVQVEAKVQLLGSGNRDIPMEEQVVNGLVDHVGVVEVALPATLRFHVTVTTPEGERETMEFSRNFEPRQN